MEDARKSFWGAACETTPRDRRNQRSVLFWSLAWVVTWLAVNYAISKDWLLPGVPAIAASLVPIALGVGTFWVYRRFLREADELRRKIELEALAFSFGVGVIGGMLYWLLARAGAFEEVDLLALVTVMLATYSVGVVVGRRRYA